MHGMLCAKHERKFRENISISKTYSKQRGPAVAGILTWPYKALYHRGSVSYGSVREVFLPRGLQLNAARLREDDCVEVSKREVHRGLAPCCQGKLFAQNPRPELQAHPSNQSALLGAVLGASDFSDVCFTLIGALYLFIWTLSSQYILLF